MRSCSAGDSGWILHRHVVAVALAAIEPEATTLQSLLDGDFPRGRPRRASPAAGTPKVRPDSLRSYAVMKPAPSSARFSVGSERASNAAIAGAVLEVGDHDRHRVVLRRRNELTAGTTTCRRSTAPGAARPPRPHEAGRRRADRHQLAVIVEPIERRDELGRRLIALLADRARDTRDRVRRALRDRRDRSSAPAAAPAPCAPSARRPRSSACSARRLPSSMS